MVLKNPKKGLSIQGDLNEAKKRSLVNLQELGLANLLKCGLSF